MWWAPLGERLIESTTKDPKNLVNIIGYDEPIAWPETVRTAFLHGATLSPEEMERRRRRRRHHTVPVYLLSLFLKKRLVVRHFIIFV